MPEMETTERLWRRHREASLLRYKEKRQNRLFSKRIRYQVRKLNAEKRPRIKVSFLQFSFINNSHMHIIGFDFGFMPPGDVE